MCEYSAFNGLEGEWRLANCTDLLQSIENPCIYNESNRRRLKGTSGNLPCVEITDAL